MCICICTLFKNRRANMQFARLFLNRIICTCLCTCTWCTCVCVYMCVSIYILIHRIDRAICLSICILLYIYLISLSHCACRPTLPRAQTLAGPGATCSRASLGVRATGYTRCPRPRHFAGRRTSAALSRGRRICSDCSRALLRADLYKIFVHFEAFMHESIILVLPFPIGIAHNSAIVLHVYFATYDPPRPPPPLRICHTLYNIGNAISCEGQAAG